MPWHIANLHRKDISHWVKYAMLALFTFYIASYTMCFNWEIMFSTLFTYRSYGTKKFMVIKSYNLLLDFLDEKLTDFNFMEVQFCA